ncbi:MAG: ATP-grasp domain-containing protein [Bacteroidales bacterium]|jgi:biotin carboxylase|nr:ATP-grasp domain-containing protein [Bacteroidales bacterium]
MKKLIILGGSYYQLTVVKAAKSLGCYVIVIDRNHNNPAKKFANEYYQLSITDKKNILLIAQQLKIDGIIAYASDIAAPTAAYVAEKLGLPTNPYEAVNILTHKDLTRSFLQQNGFKVPKSRKILNYQELVKFYREIQVPIIVKPVDAYGSKGVSKVTDKNQLEDVYKKAMLFSQSGIVIAEEFIYRKGYQIAGDAFLVDGKIRFMGLGNEHFDKLCNPLVPIGESFPANLPEKKIQAALSEIQRFMSLLAMKRGAINLDFMFDENDDICIIEIGPRSGGNLITDTIKLGTGVDLARYVILSSLGEDLSSLEQKKFYSFVASYIIHSLKNGIFHSIKFDKIKNNIVLCDMFVDCNSEVECFDNGGLGIGAMLIKFANEEEMLYMMDNMEECIDIRILNPPPLIYVQQNRVRSWPLGYAA